MQVLIHRIGPIIFIVLEGFVRGDDMTRDRLTKELEKVRLQIAKLQEKEKTLAAEKEKADMEASKAIIEKKKIEPEVLKALCDLKEQEIREILERRKQNEENKSELN